MTNGEGVRQARDLGKVGPLARVAGAQGVLSIPNLSAAVYAQFLLPFEVAALILTVGVVAAVVLTLRQRTGVRHQQASQQVRVNPRDRVRVVADTGG